MQTKLVIRIEAQTVYIYISCGWFLPHSHTAYWEQHTVHDVIVRNVKSICHYKHAHVPHVTAAVLEYILVASTNIMDKRNKCQQGGTRNKCPKGVLSGFPTASSPQSFLTPSLDLPCQLSDVGALRQPLYTELPAHLPPHVDTQPPIGHSLHSGFSSTDLSLDSDLHSSDLYLNSNLVADDLNHDDSILTDLVIDSVLDGKFDSDIDLITQLLDDESDSLESKLWMPGDEWNLESQHSQTSVTYHQNQSEPMGGRDMGVLTSTVLPGTSDQMGAMGWTIQEDPTSTLPSGTSDHELGAVGGTTLEQLTSSVFPRSSNCLNLRVSLIFQ